LVSGKDDERKPKKYPKRREVVKMTGRARRATQPLLAAGVCVFAGPAV